MAKSYRKFIAGAATTAVVASSFAGVAGAATQFDGELVEWQKPGVEYLVGKGAIEGRDNGLFDPNASITRGEAAKIIAKALNLNINPSAKASFSDTQSHWASPYIAAIETQKPGVINGQGDGTFLADKEITRQEMAKMIVKAYGLKLNEKADVSFFDAGSFADWADEEIMILASLGIVVGVGNGEFSPYTNVTRAETATFVHRAEVAGVRIDVPIKQDRNISSVNAKQVLVNFGQEVDVDSAEDESNYDVITVASKKFNAVVDAKVQADGKSVLLTLRDAYRVSTDINVTIDNVYLKGSIKEVFPKFSKVINVHDTVAPVIDSVKAETSTAAAHDITVKVSEPLAGYDASSTSNKATAFLVNGKVVKATAMDVAETEYLIGGLNLAAGSNNTVEIVNAVDYAENKAASITKTFTVVQDKTAGVGTVDAVGDNKIKVTFDKNLNEKSVKALGNIKVFRLDDKGVYEETPVTVEGSGKSYTLRLTDAASFYDGVNDNKEELLVRVSSSVVDTLGNPVTEFHKTVTLTEDAAGPVLQGITFDKNSKGEVTKLYFEFDEVLTKTSVDSFTSSDVKIKDLRTNHSVSLSQLGLDGATVTLASDEKTVIVTPEVPTPTLKAGNYEFEVQPGFVKDDAAKLNNNKKVAKAVDFGVFAPEVEVLTYYNYDTNEVIVGFNQPVKTASAINPANYLIGGKALPAGTKVVAHEGYSAYGIVFVQAITFELPEGFVAESGQVKAEVKNIQPLDSSAVFNDYTGILTIVDNTRPTVQSALLSNGLVEFTFSEALSVDGAIATDFGKVIVNGKELPTSGFTFATVAEAAKETVRLEVYADVEEVDGLFYQFIDVDSDGKYTASDIKLAVSDVKHDDWVNGMVADLNDSDVTSVAVKLVDSPQTADKAGNTLKGNTVITVK